MRKAFTLVELIIVVTILGILAAFALPTFNGQVIKVKESTAKKNLLSLRTAIELYTTQHDGALPGYVNGAAADIAEQLTNKTNNLGQVSEEYTLGPYLKVIPKNPFNKNNIIYTIGGGGSTPETYGWMYIPVFARTIKLSWPGTDSTGMEYVNY